MDGEQLIVTHTESFVLPQNKRGQKAAASITKMFNARNYGRTQRTESTTTIAITHRGTVEFNLEDTQVG